MNKNTPKRDKQMIEVLRAHEEKNLADELAKGDKVDPQRVEKYKKNIEYYNKKLDIQ